VVEEVIHDNRLMTFPKIQQQLTMKCRKILYFAWDLVGEDHGVGVAFTMPMTAKKCKTNQKQQLPIQKRMKKTSP
jgi:hypothetical protein